MKIEGDFRENNPREAYKLLGQIRKGFIAIVFVEIKNNKIISDNKNTVGMEGILQRIV